MNWYKIESEIASEPWHAVWGIMDKIEKEMYKQASPAKVVQSSIYHSPKFHDFWLIRKQIQSAIRVIRNE